MPLPLGHAAIGLVTCEICKTPSGANPFKWKTVPSLLLVIVLANLPDIDIILGLLIDGNGYAYHRGPTHSLLFALMMGYAVHHILRLSDKLPQVSFGSCFLIIGSHLVADCIFTSSPVSFFWPLEVHWIGGQEEWGDIFSTVFLKEYQDLDILAGSVITIVAIKWIRKYIYKTKHRLLMGKATQRAN
jgi:hypothetical protein